MNNQEQVKKHTKIDEVMLNCFLFVWITVAITMPSYLLELLPKHYFIYIFIQSIGYFVAYKLSTYITANNLLSNCQANDNSYFDNYKRLNDDISCGISPYNYRHETNLNTTSSISSSSYSSTSNSSSVYNSLSNNR